ncbi:hypothetical protein G7B40_004850 [Aetokthonos hydrillicola Thurmond2011]|jgi:hypothetical protein|uniref:Uncharacterized protein n=1 Tax=Aetokthonos hydrillicola Thurmond2011 TaxID=2712845 RepID=A0AAP5I2G9_9CYAN|nr:hypothetical protein [Aetokthonos hydrillicola]MBO3458309.1 hypothetical protein [Aetokthonos hydrillicola CCALA 1050]MBW4585872.1 hypothetical protein [Aetokthonos hydrillicola CCALA 1050]MDR9893903.1 hypothetical protein [Aetokthonos hydrillicola Thurmond2011]
MRTVTGSVYNNTHIGTTQPYSPSVPLSIYRDLASELQACQARINEFAAQNKELAQENQVLRQEIAKAVQSVLHLQQLLDYRTASDYNQAFNYYPDFQSQPKHPPTVTQQHVAHQQSPRPPVVTSSDEISSSMSETFFIEEEEVNYYPLSEPEASEVSGWKLVITILLIILMGFGAGYLIVRPLFEHHDR